LICAGIFGFDKILEYGGHLRAGITPATNNFFTYYYLFTGIHALHLFISICFLARMLQLSLKDVPTAEDVRFIECGASFWHLVDLLWIALFAILYLLP
jgi:nitric oxide reductase NorE protein